MRYISNGKHWLPPYQYPIVKSRLSGLIPVVFELKDDVKEPIIMGWHDEWHQEHEAGDEDEDEDLQQDPSAAEDAEEVQPRSNDQVADVRATRAAASSFWNSLTEPDKVFYGNMLRSLSDAKLRYDDSRERWLTWSEDCPFPFESPVLEAKFGDWASCEPELLNLKPDVLEFAGGSVRDAQILYNEYKEAQEEFEGAERIIMICMRAEIEQMLKWDEWKKKKDEYFHMMREAFVSQNGDAPASRVTVVALQDDDNSIFVWKEVGQVVLPDPDFFTIGGFLPMLVLLGEAHTAQWHFLDEDGHFVQAMCEQNQLPQPRFTPRHEVDIGREIFEENIYPLADIRAEGVTTSEGFFAPLAAHGSKRAHEDQIGDDKQEKKKRRIEQVAQTTTPSTASTPGPSTHPDQDAANEGDGVENGQQEAEPEGAWQQEAWQQEAWQQEAQQQETQQQEAQPEEAQPEEVQQEGAQDEEAQQHPLLPQCSTPWQYSPQWASPPSPSIPSPDINMSDASSTTTPRKRFYTTTSSLIEGKL
ncbi:hypothetical protein EJ04DRAFT_572837 [Polyplosphaeria fusca]|uniref:Uncharacterized protein n=1 Tax=Polyplosphaeria fusca TaxID=682080 RepID=A0A9P4R7T6_9PLEO|nr:hypothetical protein EJ04DRAFT_572837 [Polyplosphaeria fusca]